MQRAGPASARQAEGVAARLADVEFVSLCPRADGDALAAAGLLGRALAAIDTPFQATVTRPDIVRHRATDADLVVSIGVADPTEPDSVAGSDTPDPRQPEGIDTVDETDDSTVRTTIALPGDREPASLTATRVARELGDDPDLLLALAGGIAAAVRDGRVPFGDTSSGEPDGRSTDAPSGLASLRDRAYERGLLGDRRPGIAAPTTDLVEGMAYTTLAHAPFSGDPDAARERCGPFADDEAGRDAGREVASLLAFSVIDADDAAPRAARAVERALRPVPLAGSSVPFATLGGYADVLAAAAVERPGTGLALVLGYDVREGALVAWRTHARRAHGALRRASVSRYDGLCVARLDDGVDVDAGDGDTGPPVATLARLFRDFRSPEPVALVVGEGVGAIAATDDRALGQVVGEAARALDGAGGGTERAAEARFGGRPDEFVAAVRAALADDRGRDDTSVTSTADARTTDATSGTGGDAK